MHIRMSFGGWVREKDIQGKLQAHRGWRIEKDRHDNWLVGKADSIRRAIDIYHEVTNENIFGTDHDGASCNSVYICHEKPTRRKFPNNGNWKYISMEMVMSAAADFPVFRHDRFMMEFLSPEMVQLTTKGKAIQRAHKFILMLESGWSTGDAKSPLLLASVGRMIRKNDFEALDAVFNYLHMTQTLNWMSLDLFLSTQQVRDKLPSRAKLVSWYKEKLIPPPPEDDLPQDAWLSILAMELEAIGW